MSSATARRPTGEGSCGPAGVGSNVEGALPGRERDRLEQSLHRPPLSSPVAALLVRKAQHPGAIPAVLAHLQREAFQSLGLRADGSSIRSATLLTGPVGRFIVASAVDCSTVAQVLRYDAMHEMSAPTLDTLQLT